ncbi:MAG: Eco57I restriction-modification methylase domain-containing protein [Methanobacteriaceae archaeon]|jgi:type I restriction-modification system DNA methylase subunit|nr:Eco57I restriction-modification methylase domain-containing protein [Candidatus Methanorudis spinitermitis]
MEVPEIVKDLVKKFEDNIYSYKNPKYNETTVRQEFIDPLFIALGWDVNNEQGWAPQYREVILEDAIKIDGKTKAPDYSFTLHGQRIFFLEAKKPAVDIVNDKSPAYQLKRYSWSGKLALSVLTDFEHLAIYEAKSRPKKTDSTKIGRVKLYHYKDYIEKWEEIYNLLSKDAVLKGSFDRFASKKVKKGTSEVDDEFLKEIENWRLTLARNIAIRNKELSVEDLNYAVQLTIDRLIFLRIAEDRGIEPYKQLYKILEKENIYHEFGKLCHKADVKYNSGLFHFKEEKQISQPADTFTLELNIDNGVFKEIIKNLYYPNSPYEFSVLSPEILGNVYEQFLGKVIRLTPSNQAKIEEKPEVKKAGGVFYTPQYIVDYIVKNTVGKLVINKTPNQVAKLRIVDPACGSGSFLLGAYNYLLKWHIDYYSNLEKPPKNTIYQSKNGKWHLTIGKKKEILLNNIYGVDIDFKAVEVSKLSLLLKVLEDENKDALEQQQKLIQERVLPYLGDNIRCGNSLIATDILKDETLTLEEIANINPFDWEEEFPAIFENGGFDAVIGNPPYVRIQLLKQDKNSVKYFKENYDSAVGSYDIYNLFVEKGLKLIDNHSHLGFILPNRFISANYGKGLRDLITNTSSLNSIINFKDNQIFKGASTYTCLLFLEKNSNKFKYAEINDLNFSSKIFKSIDENNDFDDGNVSVGILDNSVYSESEWRFYIGKSANLVNKLMSMPIKLNDITEKIYVGLQTSADKIYILDLVNDKDDLLEVYSHQTKKNHLIEKKILKKYIKGKEIKKYHFNDQNKFIIFPYILNENDYDLIEQNVMKEKYPFCWKYLKENEKILRSRENNKMNDKNKWYAFTYPRSLLEYRNKKIMTPNSAFSSSFSFDSEGKYYITVGVAGGYAIKLKKDNNLNEFYLLAILNSSLMDFLNKKIGKSLRGGFYSFEGRTIKNYPIIKLSTDKQDPFIELADKMNQLNKKIANVKSPHEKKLIEKQILISDKRINDFVYDLYGLNDDEIDIIENELSDY